MRAALIRDEQPPACRFLIFFYMFEAEDAAEREILEEIDQLADAVREAVGE